MATKTVKLVNPGPSALMVVNPTGGRKSMKTQKTSRRRKATVKTASRRNPYHSLRRRNVSRRRRRNPAGGFGLLTQGLTLAGGGALTQFVTGMVPPIGGVSPAADAARTAGVAYLLGMLVGKIGPVSRFARDITLGGMAVAGGKLINQFILPTAQSVFMPRPSEPATGVKGIGVAYPGLNPYRAYSSGLNGIGVQIPGAFPFGEYTDAPMAN